MEYKRLKNRLVDEYPAHIIPKGSGGAAKRGVRPHPIINAPYSLPVARRPLPRNGKTILEMMIVIAVSSVLVSLVAGLFHHLSRTERLFRDTVVAGRAQIRLARDFRADARAASTAELIDHEVGQGIELNSGSKTIRYIPAPDGLIREQTVNTERYRDKYRLGDVLLTWTITDRLATLAVAPRRPAPPARSHFTGPFRLVAAIAADRMSINKSSSSAGPAPVLAPRPTEATP